MSGSDLKFAFLLPEVFGGCWGCVGGEYGLDVIDDGILLDVKLKAILGDGVGDGLGRCNDLTIDGLVVVSDAQPLRYKEENRSVVGQNTVPVEQTHEEE